MKFFFTILFVRLKITSTLQILNGQDRDDKATSDKRKKMMHE